jgi:copper(I)-binding protein
MVGFDSIQCRLGERLKPVKRATMIGAQRGNLAGRRWFIALAALALMIQVLVPQGYMVSGAASAPGLVICTGHGPLVVHSGDPRHPAKAPKSSDAPCGFAAHGASASAPATILLFNPRFAILTDAAARIYDLAPGRGLAARADRAGVRRPVRRSAQSNGISMSKPSLAGRLAACAIALSCTSTVAVARDYAFGPLKVTHPWSRPTPPGASTAAGYLTITNTGATPDRMLGGSSPAADKVEIHKESLAGGIMTMRPVPDGITIAAHGSVTLAPGGYHLMIFGPKHPFRPGDHVSVSLRFEHAGVVSLDLLVEQPSASPPPMSGMNMPGMH